MNIKTAFFFRIFTALVILLASAWLLFFPVQFKIIQPRLGQPFILQPGQSFEVIVKSSLPYWPTNWQAELQFADNKIPLSISKTATEFSIQSLLLKIPDTIKDSKYTLLLSDGTQQLASKSAVHIIKNPADDLSIVQMADLPTLSPSGKSPGDLQLKKIIQETNLINPQLVLFTGDLAYEGSWAQYYQLIKAMDSVNAPLIAAPGNHEYQGWSAFLSLLGQPYHCTEYSNYLIISINSGHARDQLTYSQLRWLQNTFKQNPDKTIIVQLHHSIHHRKGDRGYLQNNVKPLLDLLKEYSVPIVLSGHWHGDTVFDENGKLRNDSWKFPGTVFAVTTAAGAKLREQYSHSPLHHGYRLIRFNNRKLKNFSYDYDGDGERDASSSIPYNHLFLNYPEPYTAEIDNQLNEDFENIMVTFRLPENDTQYSVKNATLFRQYNEGNERVIQLVTDLKANSHKRVQLQEAEK